MKCSVYKSLDQSGYFLFVPGAEPFARVPDGLTRLLGKLEKVMDLELHAGRRLAHADVEEVMGQLQGQGYYLQLPPDVAGVVPHS